MLLKPHNAQRQLPMTRCYPAPAVRTQLCLCTHTHTHTHTHTLTQRLSCLLKLCVGLVFAGFRDTEALRCEGDNSQCEGAERDSQ